MMNEPIDYSYTDEDVLRDYMLYQDKKKVAKIYGISVKDVNEFIKGSKENLE